MLNEIQLRLKAADRLVFCYDPFLQILRLLFFLTNFFGEQDALFFGLPTFCRLFFTKLNGLSSLLSRPPQLLFEIKYFLVHQLRGG